VRPGATSVVPSISGPSATTDPAVAASSQRADRASVSFVCRGHPNVTGTHGKTVEVTRDVDISRRATCVLGVASDHDDRALLALRGPVEVALECDGVTDGFTATISPFFLGDSSLVFRRGASLRGRTLAFDATKTAADVDRDLVAKLGASDRELRVTITASGTGSTTGALFVVSLPIGNDHDIGGRAVEVLARVDLVLAEDTRRLHALGQRIGVDFAPATSYHDHNEAERVDGVLERLRAGARVALVSDAGTPLCSDPGYVVVSRAVAEGIPVCPVPGPSAALAVLAASGLPVDRFVFGGFLPRRSSPRQQALRELSALGCAVVLYEAAPRVGALLTAVAVVLPEWRVCLGREVTKTFEEFRQGSARELVAEISNERLLGECTLVLAPPAQPEGGAHSPAVAAADTDVDEMLRSLLAQGVPASTLAQALRVMPGVGRNQAYERVLALSRERRDPSAPNPRGR
jgi:16S rRNA (cytidine1402-2'-O)-methyltransferase